MSSGGSKPSSQTTQTVTNQMDPAMLPYYTEGMKQAGREIFTTNKAGKVTGVQPYEAYQGQRVAGFTPEQLAIQGEVYGLQSPEEFAQAQSGLTAGQVGSVGAMQQGLGSALGYQAGPIEQMGMSETPLFSQDVADYYMNPYQQTVTDTAIRSAQLEADRQRAQAAMGSIGRGTFGGARDTLAQSLAKGNTMMTIGDLQAKGSLDAFLNAQQQFERDRTAATGAERTTLEAEMDRRRMEEQGRQFEAGMGKDLFSTGLAGLTDTSKALGALGATEQEADISRLIAQAASAREQQELGQRALDVDYQTFLEGRDWNKDQLAWYANLNKQNIAAMPSTTTTSAPAPSTTSQIAGLGLAGLGLYKAMN
jgi:hypothetical protein